MDINELLEDKDNGLVSLDGRSYDIAAYAGQFGRPGIFYWVPCPLKQ